MEAQNQQTPLSPQQMEFIRKANDALGANDLTGAIQIAQEGLRSGLVHPLLLNLRAFWFEQQGRSEEALADLRRAVFIAPEDPLVRNAYGLALAKIDRRRDAVAAFREAARLAPGFAQAHFNLGWSLEAIGMLEEAATAYHEAVRLNPRYAEAIANLATICARRGQWQEARNLARQAREIDPAQTNALMAQTNAAIALGELDAAEELVTDYRRFSAEKPVDLALADSLKGDLRHAQRRFDEAFLAYSQGNAARQTIYADRYARPGQETAQEFVGWLTNYFAQRPAGWRAEPRPDPAPERAGAAGHVFLVGYPRSGTTLAENILAAHPHIVTLEEKETLNDSMRDLLSNDRGRNELLKLSGADLERYRGLYWDHVRRYVGSVEGKVFVDKHPLTSVKLPLIAKLFPNAKILFAVRDPRDVVLSCFRRTFAMNPSMYELLSLERGTRFYDAVMRLSAIYRTVFGLDWHELRHEAMIENLEAHMDEVCRFIGLDWHPAMRNFAERAKTRAIATPSSIQVMRGLNRDGVGVWRNYSQQLAPILPILEPWVKWFGYPDA